MGVVLIKWAWPKNFAHVYIYNPTILKILDPPLFYLYSYGLITLTIAHAISGHM